MVAGILAEADGGRAREGTGDGRRRQRSLLQEPQPQQPVRRAREMGRFEG